MHTSVNKRGQTVIPAPIRKRHRIQEGDRLAWLDDGETIRVLQFISYGLFAPSLQPQAPSPKPPAPTPSPR
jgi:AbrB family looped-hinge helix DNA binding protein